MRSVQVSKPNAPLEIVEKDIPEPGTRQVRIKVQACGICHSDSVTKEGLFPDIEYPKAPGHEVVGIIDKVGSEVSEWKTGQRVGVGWHGGHCFPANIVGGGTLSIVNLPKYLVYHMTVGMPII